MTLLPVFVGLVIGWVALRAHLDLIAFGTKHPRTAEEHRE